jgi:hypothetical protein
VRNHGQVHYELRYWDQRQREWRQSGKRWHHEGGAKVSFSKEESILHDIATQIGADERAHVVLLRGALGSSAVAMPTST